MPGQPMRGSGVGHSEDEVVAGHMIAGIEAVEIELQLLLPTASRISRIDI
jgi:hypothetical protein